MIQTVAGSSANAGFKDGFLANVTPKAIAPNSDPLFPIGFRTVHHCRFLRPFGLAATLFKKPYSQLLHYSVAPAAPSPRRQTGSSSFVQALQQTNGAIFTLSQFMFTIIPTYRRVRLDSSSQRRRRVVARDIWTLVCKLTATRDLNESIDCVMFVH